MLNPKKRKLQDMSGDPLQGRLPLTKRRHTPSYELIEFLSRGIGSSHAYVSKRNKKAPNFQISKKKTLVLRRQLTESMQALVVFLRYGTLQDDSREWHTATEVFRRTGVKVQTQQGVIRRWRERGFLIINVKRPGGKKMMSEEQIRWIVNPTTLANMAHMSLRQRSVAVKNHFGIGSFCASTLREYYRQYGVKYKRPDYRYWKSFAEDRDLQMKQMEFLKKLGTLIKEEAYDEVVYLDETTFHL